LNAGSTARVKQYQSSFLSSSAPQHASMPLPHDSIMWLHGVAFITWLKKTLVGTAVVTEMSFG